MEKENLELENLVDLDFLQKFQDAFAQAMDIGCLTYDMDKPVTKPSNFSDFCKKHTLNSEAGRHNCRKCFLHWGKIAAETGKPTIYTCHTGLTNMAVPIMLDNKQIGTIHAGQIFTEAVSEEKVKELARIYGIDENEYLKASREITIIPKENINAVADLLFLVANAFSQIGNQNFKLLKKNQREILYRTVVEALRNSLDIELTKRKIVNIIGEALDADRCFITEYDSQADKFLIVSNEYLSSNEVQSYKGMNVNVDIPNFLKEIKFGNSVVVQDGKILKDDKSKNFEQEEMIIKKYNVQSSYAVPFKYYDKLLGVLSLHYTNSYHKCSDEELELVKMIANQVGIAIYQARLFNTIKQQAQRERIGKAISEILRSSLEKELIKHLFVINIGKYFNADRVFFSEYDTKNKCYLPFDKQSEYLSDKEQLSFVNYDWNCTQAKEYMEPLLNKRELIIKNLEKYLQENQKSDDFVRLFRESSVKSSYNFPVLYEEKIMGYFCIEFTKEVKELTDDDIICIRGICSQAGIALYHSLLYKKAHDEASEECRIIKELYSKIKVSLKDMLEYSDKILNNGENPLKTKQYLKELKEKETELLELLNTIKD